MMRHLRRDALTGAASLLVFAALTVAVSAQKSDKGSKEQENADPKRPKITLKAQPLIAMAPARVVLTRSCELNEEPRGQCRNDEKQQCAHSRGASPITCSTSRLPVSPPDVRFRVGDDRNVSRHRSASWMLSDTLW